MTYEERVKQAKENGQSYIIVNDNDNEMYESGFADYLMTTYNYSNMKNGFRANISTPTIHRVGGEFADPNN